MLLSVCLSLPQQQTSSKQTSTVSHLQQQQQQPSAIDMALHHNIFSLPFWATQQQHPISSSTSSVQLSIGHKQRRGRKREQAAEAEAAVVVIGALARTHGKTDLDQSISSAQLRQIGSQSVTHTLLLSRSPVNNRQRSRRKRERDTN